MTVVDDSFPKSAGSSLEAFNRLEWFMLAIGSIFAGLACVWIAGIFGIPREPQFSGSLLLGGAATVAMLAIIVAIAFSLLIGSLTAWFVEIEAPLFCCCLGIAALGVRCGSIRPVLQYAANSAVFISLAVEAVLLGVFLVGGWLGLGLLLGRVLPKKDRRIFFAANEIANAATTQKVGTLLVQMVVMAVVELILIQTDAKAQAMAGVFIAGYLGSLAAYQFTPLPNGIWYWTGPSLVGAIGYVLSYFFTEPLTTGDIHGWCAALARATPIDYISMGTAGALLGYWSIRRWMQPVDDSDNDATVTG